MLSMRIYRIFERLHIKSKSDDSRTLMLSLIIVTQTAVSYVSCNCQLAAKEAYLAAKAEIADEDRRRMLAEFRTIIKEAAASAAEAATDRVAAAKFGAAAQAALLATEGAPPPKTSNEVGINGSHASTTRDLHSD